MNFQHGVFFGKMFDIYFGLNCHWISILRLARIWQSTQTGQKFKITYIVCWLTSFLEFIYSEKATKFCEISTLLLSYMVPVKSKEEISQNFVVFSEYMNFKEQMRSKKLRTCYISRCRHHELFFRLPHTESLRKPKPKTEPPVLCPTGGFESWLGAALVAPPRHILL